MRALDSEWEQKYRFPVHLSHFVFLVKFPTFNIQIFQQQ